MTAANTEELGGGFFHHGVPKRVSNQRGTVATADADGRNVVLVWLFARRYLHRASGPAAVACLLLAESFLHSAGAAVSDVTTGLLVLAAAALDGGARRRDPGR